jgi:hypothetical protein
METDADGTRARTERLRGCNRSAYERASRMPRIEELRSVCFAVEQLDTNEPALYPPDGPSTQTSSASANALVTSSMN